MRLGKAEGDAWPSSGRDKAARQNGGQHPALVREPVPILYKTREAAPGQPEVMEATPGQLIKQASSSSFHSPFGRKGQGRTDYLFHLHPLGVRARACWGGAFSQGFPFPIHPCSKGCSEDKVEEKRIEQGALSLHDGKRWAIH